VKNKSPVIENEIPAGNVNAKVIYISCMKAGETQKQLADASDISDMTLRSRLKDLEHPAMLLESKLYHEVKLN
jgi:transcription initiation factor TFIIIB Brf1 subunit/transcription initiation factor TFIIB